MKKFLVKYKDRSFILRAEDKVSACEKLLSKLKDSESRFTANNSQEALNFIKAYDGSCSLFIDTVDGLSVSIVPTDEGFVVSTSKDDIHETKQTLDEAKIVATSYVNF